MKFKELQNKETSDLHKLLAENREQLRQLRFKDAVNQLKDVRKIRNTKKAIARISTLLNQREKRGGGQK
jgi:large subunit ribosomal protein L29